MEKHYRILIVGPVPPPMGGIVRYAQDMMSTKFVGQHSFVLFRDNIPAEYRPRTTTAKNTWNIFKRDGLLNTVKVFVFVFRRMLDLNRTLSQGNFDIMHVLSTAGYGFFRNSVHIAIAKKQGVKTIFHLLGQIDDLYRDGGSFLKRLVSFALNIADVHIVQSPLLAAFVGNITKRPVYSIFNGVRAKKLIAPDGYAHSSGDEMQVVTLGYIGYQKGTFDIIEAAEKIKDMLPTMKFTFIGGGEVEKFRDIVGGKNLSNITFLGRLDDDTCIKIMQSSDIFLLPSHAEGQPIALLEALAVGLPVISSTVGSIPEVVKEGVNGFLVKPGDVDGIVDHLVILGSNETLRVQIGRFNAKEAQEKYKIERVMHEIQQVYDKLAN